MFRCKIPDIYLVYLTALKREINKKVTFRQRHKKEKYGRIF
jgi:hypothetical protein